MSDTCDAMRDGVDSSNSMFEEMQESAPQAEQMKTTEKDEMEAAVDAHRSDKRPRFRHSSSSVVIPRGSFVLAVTTATFLSLFMIFLFTLFAYKYLGGKDIVSTLTPPLNAECKCSCESPPDIADATKPATAKSTNKGSIDDFDEKEVELEGKSAPATKGTRHPRAEFYQMSSSQAYSEEAIESAKEQTISKKGRQKKIKKKKKKKKKKTSRLDLISKKKPMPKELTPAQMVIVNQLNDKGITSVNAGTQTSLDQAITAFTKALEMDPVNYVALVGRGSALSLRSDLPSALDDFSTALSINSDHAEAWKRRGQTYAAIGDLDNAIADLLQALNLPGSDEDVSSQIGMLYQRQRNYVDALKYLKRSVRERGERGGKPSASLLNSIGQCYVSTGESEKAIVQYLRSLDIEPHFQEAWVNSAQASLQLADLQQTLKFAKSATELNSNLVQAWHMSLLAHYGSGNMRATIVACENCMSLSSSLSIKTWVGLDAKSRKKVLSELRSNYEETCLWQRGMAFMAMGQLGEAIAQFDFLLQIEKERNSYNEEDYDKDTHHLAFYQREWAIFQLRNLDRDVRKFNPDRDIHPYFKELYTMREMPNILVNELGYEVQMRPALKRVEDVTFQPFIKNIQSRSRRRILEAQQKHFPKALQLRTPGFLSNDRQHRQAGLAILTIAQQLRKHWQKIRDGPDSKNYLKVPGSASSDGSLSDDHDHAFGWRDAFDVAVKWRQLVSANDSVWWIDQLGRWDDESTNQEGFGLRTPMVSGQLKVVRYYPYFRKAFESMRSLITTQYDDLSKRQKERIPHATTLAGLYKLLDERDFWVTSLCHSEASPGRVMEGTRLTVERQDYNHGFEFTIRTPGTKPRWEQYSQELDHQFDRLADIVTTTTPRERNRTEVATIAAKIFFYWVNFAPLSRGSAATGYVGLHAVLLAAGYKIENPIPIGVQADWEAILTSSPIDFVEALKGWLIDDVQPCSTEGGGIDGVVDWLGDLSDVGSEFKTYRDMYEALNIGDIDNDVFYSV